MITPAKAKHVSDLGRLNPIDQIRQEIADAHKQLNAPHFLFELTRRTLHKRINRLQEELRDLWAEPTKEIFA